MNDFGDLFDIVLAGYLDYVEKEQLDKLKDAYRKCKDTETEVRRKKASEQIRAISSLRIELNKLEFEYLKIKVKTGKNIDVIDDYIEEIQLKINRLIREKNHM